MCNFFRKSENYCTGSEKLTEWTLDDRRLSVVCMKTRRSYRSYARALYFLPDVCIPAILSLCKHKSSTKIGSRMHKVFSRMLYYAFCRVLFLTFIFDPPKIRVIVHMLKVIGRMLFSTSYEITSKDVKKRSSSSRPKVSFQIKVDIRWLGYRPNTDQIFPFVCFKVSSRVLSPCMTGL